MKKYNYRDNVNTRHNETKKDKQMKTLHRILKEHEQHLTKAQVCLCIKSH